MGRPWQGIYSDRCPGGNASAFGTTTRVCPDSHEKRQAESAYVTARPESVKLWHMCLVHYHRGVLNCHRGVLKLPRASSKQEWCSRMSFFPCKIFPIHKSTQRGQPTTTRTAVQPGQWIYKDLPGLVAPIARGDNVT